MKTPSILLFLLGAAVATFSKAYEMKMMKMWGKGKGKGSSSSKGKSSSVSMMSSYSSKGKGWSSSSYKGSSMSMSYKGNGSAMMMKMMMMGKGKGKGKGGYGLVTQVDLGSMRPEGVTAGPGSIMYTSELFFGGVKAVDVVTGKVTQAVPSYGFFERLALGLWYAKDAIFVAGGGVVFGVDPALHVYSAKDGTEIVTCNPAEAGFLNDLIVYDDYLYVTDSGTANLFVFDVYALLAGKCDYHTITLPDSFSGEGFPFANGIEVYKGGLIVANNGGDGGADAFEFWYVDLKSGDMSFLYPSSGDGLLVDGDILYACEPPANSLGVYELDYSKKTGVTMKFLATITSDLFRVASTVAQYKDTLYLVNARFDVEAPAEGEGDPATFPEDFDLFGLPTYD